MPVTRPQQNTLPLRAIALVAAFVFLYSGVLTKLGFDWWTDENYSHGLLVPLVIAIIVWREWDVLRSSVSSGAVWLGSTVCIIALLLLTAGVLGAELFTTRISLVLMVAGIIVYLFGTRVLRPLAVPFGLLLLSIPIPQIVFNKIALPLQTLASKMAVWGIRIFDVPTLRSGNVIDILPVGATQSISLEVVEACSGIRSLMTLVTLALVLAYFTRRSAIGGGLRLRDPDLWRAIILMISAVPVAVVTNAARVTTTGVLTYHYGKQAAGGTAHDISGWLAYLLALLLLFGINLLLIRSFRRQPDERVRDVWVNGPFAVPSVLPLIAVLFFGGLGVSWLSMRGETEVPRQPLAYLPAKIGEWQQKGDDIRFDMRVEGVLRTTDYVMREYAAPDGRVANIYIGYYASQRTGATYHSPQNCLPGAGWVMSEPELVEIPQRGGGTFSANRYIVENGTFREVMIYWYQGRGRTEASEYTDKLNVVRDSIVRGRSDGALIRVMTSAGEGTAASEAAADMASQLSADLDPFIPQ